MTVDRHKLSMQPTNRPAMTHSIDIGLRQLVSRLRSATVVLCAFACTAAVAAPKTISAQALATKIDSFLASRGYKPPDSEPMTTVQDGGVAPRADNPAEFICEDDVRAALRSGRKLLVGERTIITPAARDLGESQKVFQQAGWPR